MGVPDRVFISPSGCVCWVEFKAPGREPRAIQAKMGEELKDRHQFYNWFDSRIEAIQWLMESNDIWVSRGIPMITSSGELPSA